ncbi:MAG: putative Ig domain-containing protein, partial [Pararhodobacter sp.]|nr:putative Ig domain-containing protein [Pararhodobacter sp.]
MSRLVFFSADDGVYGRELWVTDGTPVGTRMVRDTAPGLQGGLPGYFSSDLTSLGDGRVIFEAGNAVWASDGTESGTIRMGEFPDDPARFTLIARGEVVFRGRDERGSELWISDGTPGGTELLKEFQEGLHPDGWALGGFPTGLTPVRPGRVVFAADDGVHGTELWVTDGTEAGTQMIGDLRPGEESGNPRFLTQIRPGLVIFEANSTLTGGALWATDGTAGGTRMIADLTDGPAGSILGPFTVLPGGQAAFTNLSGPSWITDGTAAGTYRLGSLPNMPEAPTIPETRPLSVGELGIFREGSPITLGQLGDGRLLFSATTREGTEWYTVDPCVYWFPPECQPGYTGAGSCENPSPCPWPLRDELASRPLGRELWVTDGTQGGTRLVADLWPGASSGDPSGFLLIPNGRALFVAREDDGSFLGTRALWATNGSAEGTVKLIAGIGTPTWPVQTSSSGIGPDDRRLVVIDGGANTANTGVWATDGTEAGTELLFPNASEVRLSMSPSSGFLALPGGAVLTSTSLFGGGFRTWVTDGTAAGTRAVSDTLATWHMSDPVSMGDGRIIFTRNDPDIGREPWVFDTNSGAVVLLGDIMPGTEGSDPKDFVLAVPMPSQVPVSTLFDALVSTQDEEQELPIGGFFTDPSGTALDFTVVGLPDGVTFDPATRQIDGTPADTGVFPVSVIVTNDLGGAVEAVFDWSVIDTGLLTLVSSTGWAQPDPDGPINARPGAILMIGRKDGEAPLIRIEGAEASIEDGKLTVSGKLFAEQYATTLPLMQGSFTIDMATLTVSDFEDEEIDASHRLVGDLIEMAFTDIALRPDEVVLRTDLSFGDAFTVFSTQGGLLALHLSDDGPAFGFSEVGTGRWFTDKPLALPLPEGAPFAVEFAELGMNYDLLTDSIYLMGKAELTWGETVAKEYSFLADSTTSKLTFDLAGEQADDDLFARGDKFLRIGKDAQGWNWDIVGEIAYEGQEGGTPARGRPFIEEMTFSLDTVEKEFGGGFKGTLPFLFKGLTLEAEIGATWDPIAIDSFAFGIDGLNKPLGATGLFVQGGKLAAENLTAQDPEEWPEVSARITMTVGPNTEIFVSPIRGFVGGKIKAAQVTLDFEAESKVAYLLPGEIERIAAPLIRWLGVDADDVLAFELMKLTGDVSVDFARPGFSAGLGAGFLGEMITGQAQFTSQTLGDVTYLNASVSATATFPEALPLIGGLSRAGNGLAKFSSDGDNANDFAAAWINFTLPFIGSSSAGVRLWLDGRYEVLGRKAIDAIGSWELGPELDVVILSAQWENASDSARLELIAPDGTVLSEGDFGTDTGLAAGIALVDDLNGPLG